MFILALSLLGAALPGCGASPNVHTMPPVHQPVVVVGDWNDVEAAVLVGAGHADMALVGPARSQNPDLEQRFDTLRRRSYREKQAQ